MTGAQGAVWERSVVRPVLFLVGLMAVGALPPAAAASAPCNRTCLIAMARTYAGALIAHAPSRLPVTPHVRFTENLVPLAYGRQGLWRTVTGRRNFNIYAADVRRHNVVWIGIVKENGIPVMMAARLKVHGGKVSELETVVGRSPLNAAGKVKAPRPDFARIVPRAERMSRKQLIAVADSNWDAMEQANGHLAPYAAGCERYDNGLKTTHGGSPGPDGKGKAAPLGCFGQMNSGRFRNGNTVDPRRIWAVDRAHGLVVGLFTPNVPGTVRQVKLRDGKIVKMGPGELRPFTIVQVEMFKIVGGQISKVEVVLGPRVPFGMRSPFDMKTLWQKR